MSIGKTSARTQESIKDLWALLWSRDQGSQHVEPLWETIETGLSMMSGNATANDYIVMFVGTKSEVAEMADLTRDRVRARHAADEALGLIEKPRQI